MGRNRSGRCRHAITKLLPGGKERMCLDCGQFVRLLGDECTHHGQLRPYGMSMRCRKCGVVVRVELVAQPKPNRCNLCKRRQCDCWKVTRELAALEAELWDDWRDASGCVVVDARRSR